MRILPILVHRFFMFLLSCLVVNIIAYLTPILLMLPRDLVHIHLGHDQQLLFDPLNDSHAQKFSLGLDILNSAAFVVNKDPQVTYEEITIRDKQTAGQPGSHDMSAITMSLGSINFARNMKFTLKVECDVSYISAYVSLIPRMTQQGKDKGRRIEVPCGETFEWSYLKGLYEINFERYAPGQMIIEYNLTYEKPTYHPVKGSVLCFSGPGVTCRWNSFEGGKIILLSNNRDADFEITGRERYPWQLRYDWVELLLISGSFLIFFVLGAGDSISLLLNRKKSIQLIVQEKV